jgi:AraC-like DNA-binding protein
MELELLMDYLSKVLSYPVREYDTSLKLKRVFGEFNAYPDSLIYDLQTIAGFYEKREQLDYPLYLYSHNDQTILLIENNAKNRIYLLGTVQADPDQKQRKDYIETDWSLLLDSGLLVYTVLTGVKLTKHDFLMSMKTDSQFLSRQGKKVIDTHFRYNEEQTLHNPYTQELREQGSIREGNVDRLMMSFKENYAGKLARLSKNKLRSLKNLGIVVLAISTRSAIEGGLHPEKAFLLSDSYILSIDEATTENEIYSTVRNAEIHFTELVAENKQNKSENPLVLRAKNSIFKRMHEKVTLGSIARELNTTASYLSTVFKKETGITVQQFIVKEKLLVAANLLCYSQYEIHEIANYLSFSSQSHFGHLFKLHFQMTPNQYRLKYGAQEG